MPPKRPSPPSRRASFVVSEAGSVRSARRDDDASDTNSVISYASRESATSPRMRAFDTITQTSLFMSKRQGSFMIDRQSLTRESLSCLNARSFRAKVAKVSEEKTFSRQQKIYCIFDPAMEMPSKSFARASTVVSVVMLLLILGSVVMLCIESLPHYEGRTGMNTGFFVAETVFVVCFTIELVVRFSFVADRKAFLSDAYNWIDFISVIPYYATLIVEFAGGDGAVQSLVFLRVIRLFRVLRVLKLGQYSRPLKVTFFVLAKSFESVNLLVFMMFIASVLFASLIFLAEQSGATFDTRRRTWVRDDGTDSPFQSIPHTFWWTVVTLTTVGYGDEVPQTVWGKLVAGLCIVTGIFIVACPVVLISYNFNEVMDALGDEKSVNDESLIELSLSQDGLRDFAEKEADESDECKNVEAALQAIDVSTHATSGSNSKSASPGTGSLQQLSIHAANTRLMPVERRVSQLSQSTSHTEYRSRSIGSREETTASNTTLVSGSLLLKLPNGNLESLSKLEDESFESFVKRLQTVVTLLTQQEPSASAHTASEVFEADIEGRNLEPQSTGRNPLLAPVVLPPPVNSTFCGLTPPDLIIKPNTYPRLRPLAPGQVYAHFQFYGTRPVSYHSSCGNVLHFRYHPILVPQTSRGVVVVVAKQYQETGSFNDESFVLIEFLLDPPAAADLAKAALCKALPQRRNVEAGACPLTKVSLVAQGVEGCSLLSKEWHHPADSITVRWRVRGRRAARQLLRALPLMRFVFELTAPDFVEIREVNMVNFRLVEPPLSP